MSKPLSLATTVAAIGRLVNLTQQHSHYNGHVCHSAQRDGTFQPSSATNQVNVRVVGDNKILTILPINIATLPSHGRRDNDNGWVFTSDMRVALRDEDGNDDGGGVDDKKKLHTLLQHIPHIGGVTAVLNEILSYLRIQRVDATFIRAVTASSHMLNVELSHTLDERLDRWWISKEGSCPNGIGNEWVSYDLCCRPSPNSTTTNDRWGRRRRKVVMMNLLRLVIPPLPQGPLSVRKFHLEVSDTSAHKEGPWTVATEELTTLDTPEVQEWSIDPPIESRFVRIVCRENAAAVFHPVYTCIGFFTIGFS